MVRILVFGPDSPAVGRPGQPAAFTPAAVRRGLASRYPADAAVNLARDGV
jgi:hypothetical protein